ncbi:hypothetical protein Lesp02_18420 [Lentzea sp. NBRC 105346]|uniref:hypothetical protein n=1 Tax=Lentzea sp. NBRC 105346 TaxID=3032205 RepID=UPI0024A21CFB|nr:hypothetical protein [Lentzea sp. NBRC 105346]GLZ29652.1 hypothetical protein Lesp02_18420 [Lentzea sp. NBRC 105346]
MVGTKTHFSKHIAPCGRQAEGDHHRDDDDAGFVVDDLIWDCGCRQIRHAFHDGSMRVQTVRHDGKILADEHSGDHEA